jgi:hypothetical protein
LSGGTIRQVHRVVSMAFTVAAIVNIAAVVTGSSATWLGILAVVPLIPLILTGVYLFALPYAAKWRGERRTA